MPVIIDQLEQFKKDMDFAIGRLLDFFYTAFQKNRHKRFLTDIRKIEQIQIKYFPYTDDDDECECIFDEDEEDY